MVLKSELVFMVKLPYELTCYKLLDKIALTHYWKDKESYWFFKFQDLELVEKTLGHTVEIPIIRDKFNKKEITIPKFKGKDFVEIYEFPLIYQVIEHRKQENNEVKELKHEVSKVLVDSILKNIILKQPLNKPIKTRTVAEKVCKLLGITRFNRDSGSFDFAKFFGNRRDYYKYFYLPIKVLVFLGYVKHHKKGYVERIK